MWGITCLAIGSRNCQTEIRRKEPFINTFLVMLNKFDLDLCASHKYTCLYER